MNLEFRGFFYTILSSILISSAFIIGIIVVRSINPESSSAYLFLAAVITSFLFLSFTKRLHELKIFTKYWRPMILLGIINGFAVILWFYTLVSIGPSVTAFLLRLITVFSVLLGVFFLKERLNKLEIFGIIITMIGAFIITYAGNFLILGAMMAVILSLMFSVGQLIAKVYVKVINPIILNQFRLSFTLLTVLIYSLIFAKLQIPSLEIAILSILQGIIAGFFGFILFYKAMELIALSKAITIRSLDPFVVLFYSFIFLGEFLTMQELIGGAVIVLGILILTIAHKPKIIERWIP